MTPLSWDALLDDYEDRIDEMWTALDQSRGPDVEPFVTPAGGAPPAPTRAQLDRLAALHADAQSAAIETQRRMRSNAEQRDELRRTQVGHKAYATANRFGR